MHKEMEDFARRKIKEGLGVLSEKHRDKFRRIYSHKDLNRPIDEIVDSMPAEHLSQALTQVNNSRSICEKKQGEL